MARTTVSMFIHMIAMPQTVYEENKFPNVAPLPPNGSCQLFAAGESPALEFSVPYNRCGKFCWRTLWIRWNVLESEVLRQCVEPSAMICLSESLVNVEDPSIQRIIMYLPCRRIRDETAHEYTMIAVAQLSMPPLSGELTLVGATKCPNQHSGLACHHRQNRHNEPKATGLLDSSFRGMCTGP